MKKMMLLACILGSGSLWAKDQIPSESAELSVNIIPNPELGVLAVMMGVTFEAKEGFNKLTRNIKINVFRNGDFIETRELMPKGKVYMTAASSSSNAKIEIYEGADLTGKKLLETGAYMGVGEHPIVIKENIFGKIKV